MDVNTGKDMQVAIQAGKLKDILYTMDKTCTEGFLHFNHDNLTIIGVSSGKVMFLRHTLLDEVFEMYQVGELEGYEENRVALHMENFYRMIKKFDADDIVWIEVRDSKVYFESDNIEMSLPVLEMEPELTQDDIANISLERVKVELGPLDNAIEVGSMSDDLTIVRLDHEDQQMTFSTDGTQSTASMSVSIETDVDRDIRSAFTSSHINQIANCVSKLFDDDEQVTLEIDDEHPMKIRHGLEIESEFFIAPRIEDELE